MLRDFNPVMSAALDPGRHGSEVMINEKLATAILDLIDDYDIITESRKGKAILNSVRQDIRNLKNRTLTEIRSMYP